jgi:hypothetical protein
MTWVYWLKKARLNQEVVKTCFFCLEIPLCWPILLTNLGAVYVII